MKAIAAVLIPVILQAQSTPSTAAPSATRSARVALKIDNLEAKALAAAAFPSLLQVTRKHILECIDRDQARKPGLENGKAWSKESVAYFRRTRERPGTVCTNIYHVEKTISARTENAWSIKIPEISTALEEISTTDDITLLLKGRDALHISKNGWANLARALPQIHQTLR